MTIEVIKIAKEQQEQPVLKIKKLTSSAELPEYPLESDMGFDIRANETVTINRNEQETIKTGLIMEIPQGYIGLVRDRAGIITKMGLHTAAGTFDPGYRGEVSIVMVNYGDEDIQIEKGMRIAQMIILPVAKVKIEEVKKVSETKRQERGFSSTGMKEIIK